MFKIRTFTSLHYNIFMESIEVKRPLHFESKKTTEHFRIFQITYTCIYVCIYAYIYLTKYQFITLNIFLL